MRPWTIRLAPLALLTALAAAPAGGQEATKADLAELIRGTWKIVGEDGEVTLDCDVGQHFEPNEDGSHIILTELGNDEFSADYQVILVEGNRFLSYIENEDRLTDEGDPVLWWGYFTDQNRFVWRRYDWGRNDATAAAWVRCAEE